MSETTNTKRREMKFEGSKLESTRGMSTTEIAKLVREDVKVLVKSKPELKGLKVSVKTSYYSMGSSITLKITALPEGFQIYTSAYLDACAAQNTDCPQTDGGAYGKRWFYVYESVTPEATALKKELESLVNAYNYDDSDSQTDYYCVRFADSVDFGWELEKAQRAAGKAVRS